MFRSSKEKLSVGQQIAFSKSLGLKQARLWLAEIPSRGAELGSRTSAPGMGATQPGQGRWN